jgi:prolyl-tRNA synthetase
MGRRDKPYKERKAVPRQEFTANIIQTLDDMQAELFRRAEQYRKDNTVIINNKDEFYEYFKGDGGFALAHWNGDADLEAKIKSDLSVTIRCIPFENDGPGKCIFTGEPSKQRVVFAKAY